VIAQEGRTDLRLCTQEWLLSWVQEIGDVSRILRMGAPIELAAVPRIDEQFERVPQGLHRAGEAA